MPALGVQVDGQWFHARHANSSASLSPGSRSPALSSSTQTTPLDLMITPATPNSATDSCASVFFASPTAPDATFHVAQEIDTKIQDEVLHEEVDVTDPILSDTLVSSPTSLDFTFQQASIAEQLGFDSSPRRRRGLLIGIRYWGSTDVLVGAYNDIDDMKNLLVENFGWTSGDFMVLKDDKTDPGTQPTRDIILREMRNLVRDARPGDQLFFHFAGHGGQVYDIDGDEVDELDEVILTCDGHRIVDDEMFNVLVFPLPMGCRLTAVFDCCNSGTGLDLPEIVRTDPLPQLYTATRSRSPSPILGMVKTRRLRPRAPFRRLTQREAPIPARANDNNGRPALYRKNSDGDVVLWSACLDSEDAFEMTIGGAVRGALTYNFVRSLRAKQHSYRSLLSDLSTAIMQQAKGKHIQTPQLSSSHPIPMDAWISI